MSNQPGRRQAWRSIATAAVVLFTGFAASAEQASELTLKLKVVEGQRPLFDTKYAITVDGRQVAGGVTDASGELVASVPRGMSMSVDIMPRPDFSVSAKAGIPLTLDQVSGRFDIAGPAASALVLQGGTNYLIDDGKAELVVPADAEVSFPSRTGGGGGGGHLADPSFLAPGSGAGASGARNRGGAADAAAPASAAAPTTSSALPTGTGNLYPVPADAGEPDSCLLPRNVVSGQNVVASLNPSTDGDFFQILLNCGDTLQVRMTPSNGVLIAITDFYAPGELLCNTAGFQANGAFTPNGQIVSSLMTATATGLHKFRIRAFGYAGTPTGEVSYGAYSAAIRVIPAGPSACVGAVVDPFEGSDLCGVGARNAGDGVVDDRIINTTADRDLYAIDADCGTTSWATMTPTGARTLRAGLQLFTDPSDCLATGLLATINAVTTGTPILTGIKRIADAPTTPDAVYRWVFRSATTLLTTGSYTVGFSSENDGMCAVDSVDASTPDNSAATAGPLPAVGVPQERTHAPSGEEDWYDVQLACGEVFEVQSLVPQSPGRRRADTLMNLYLPPNLVTAVATNDDSGFEFLSRLSFTAPAAGLYKLRVSNFAGTGITAVGGYALHVIHKAPGLPLQATVAQVPNPPLGTQLTASLTTPAQGYSLTTGANALVDISGTGTLASVRSDGVVLLNIPFGFQYYGRTMSQLMAMDNGVITFEDWPQTQGSNTNPCPFSAGVEPLDVIAPFWDQMNLAIGSVGNIFWEVQGLTPNRQLIVQWDKMTRAGTVGSSLTFQAILFEGSGDIEFRYGLMSHSTPALAAGSSASIGLSDRTGRRTTTVSCNVAVVGGLTGKSYRFAAATGNIPYPVGQVYTVATSDGNLLVDIAGTAGSTNHNLGDDTGVTVPLPFTFTFYGNNKTTVGIASNGYLTFSGVLTTLTNTCLPSATDPDDLIAPFWDDFLPQAGVTNVWSKTTGVAGNQRFIVQWNQIGLYNAGSPLGSHTFQAILHETTNQIEFNYGVLTGSVNSMGGAGTIGIENFDGSVATSVSCNQNILAQGRRYVFTPSPSVVTEWRDAVSNALLGSGLSYFAPADGACEIRFEAFDLQRPCNTFSQLISLPDQAGPVVTTSAEDLACLWPPNHFLVGFDVTDFTAVAVDNCALASQLTYRIGACVCDQPANDTGDGNTDFDCVVAPDGLSVMVRSERQGNDPDGRRCAIQVIATDPSGNESAPGTIGNIYIPHDMSPQEVCVRSH